MNSKLCFGRRRCEPTRKKTQNSGWLLTADITAVICAVICAVSLCAFCAGDCISTTDADKAVAAAKITYNEPEKKSEWSFWDYFSDLCAGLLGYSEA